MSSNSMMKYIQEHVDDSTNLPETLPLMHSCDGFDCERIIQDTQ